MTPAWKHPLTGAFLPMLLSLACGSGGGDGPGFLGLEPCESRVATGKSPLIDDMNDNDASIPNNDGRQGGWYVYNDGTGAQVPEAAPKNTCAPPVAPPISNGQACTSGSGFTEWGSAIGVSINVGGECLSCNYDGTVHNGIRFTISGSVPNGSVRFRVITAETNGIRWGGTCADETKCTDAFGSHVPVAAQPQTVEVPWTTLSQQGYGTKASFNIQEIFGLDWQIAPGAGAPFKLCIDDVMFF